MCDRVSVWEKENEKDRARDEERKIKAERTRSGQWRKSPWKIKTWWDLRGVGLWGWEYVCGGKKTREKKRKEKEKKRMDGRGGSIKNKKIKNHN